MAVQYCHLQESTVPIQNYQSEPVRVWSVTHYLSPAPAHILTQSSSRSVSTKDWETWLAEKELLVLPSLKKAYTTKKS